MSSLNGPWGCRAKRVCVVDTQVLGQCIRGACIAGKPGSYKDLRRALPFYWSRLACDGIGGVSVRARRLHRGQARLLQGSAQGTVFLLEQACLRWRQRGVSTCAASASRASPAPTGIRAEHCLSVGAGLPAMASERCQYVRGACIAGKPGSYRDLRRALLFCWSRLACDGVGGVSVDARRLNRGQARLLQRSAQGTAFLLEQACLRWRRRGVSRCAAPESRASPAPTRICEEHCFSNRGQARLLQGSAKSTAFLLELACLRWRQRGVSTCAAPASRASPAPTRICAEHCLSVGAGSPAMASPRVSVNTRRLHRGQARLLQGSVQGTTFLLEQACLRWRRRGVSEYAAPASRASPAPTGICAGHCFSVGAGLPAMASAGCQ